MLFATGNYIPFKSISGKEQKPFQGHQETVEPELPSLTLVQLEPQNHNIELSRNASEHESVKSAVELKHLQEA